MHYEGLATVRNLLLQLLTLRKAQAELLQGVRPMPPTPQTGADAEWERLKTLAGQATTDKKALSGADLTEAVRQSTGQLPGPQPK